MPYTQSATTREVVGMHTKKPTHNLDNVDPACAELDYITDNSRTGSGRALDIEYLLSNNFAFGCINTSLVFRCWA